MRRLKEASLDLVFPVTCIGCGARGAFLCASCVAALPRLQMPVCTRCGKPLHSGLVCRDCASRSIDVDGLRSILRFDGVARQAILQFKYRGLRALASPLAGLLGDYLVAHPLPADILVPVPLHPRRLRERGYNQSALLARELSRVTSLPVAEKSLVRPRNTPAQTRTRSASERRRNVAAAFACRGHHLNGRRVLLIDDVCTSGATLNACAAVVRAAGASSVWGLTVARETWRADAVDARVRGEVN